MKYLIRSTLAFGILLGSNAFSYSQGSTTIILEDRTPNSFTVEYVPDCYLEYPDGSGGGFAAPLPSMEAMLHAISNKNPRAGIPKPGKKPLSPQRK